MSKSDFDAALETAKQAGREEAMKAVAEIIDIDHYGIRRAYLRIKEFRTIENKFGMKWHSIGEKHERP